MTTEEKAAAYDEALKVANKYKDTHIMFPSIKDEMFPELKESEDEKVRKWIIENIQETLDVDGFFEGHKTMAKNAIAWLEKQGEQKSIVEMKTPEESLGIDSDTYNKIVDECIYGEQKPADKVEPKFKVGQTIKKEGFNLGFPIVKIENGFYYNDMGDNFPFTDQDNWKLVEQKPAWSENDEEQLGRALYMMEQLDMTKSWDDVYNWLKSLRPQNQWKPSDEQMKALDDVISSKDIKYDVLSELYKDLKKLREE